MGISNVHHVRYIHIERDRSEYLEGNAKWLINCNNHNEKGVNITSGVLKINKTKSWIFFAFSLLWIESKKVKSGL